MLFTNSYGIEKLKNIYIYDCEKESWAARSLEELGFFGAATVRHQRWRELAGFTMDWRKQSKREESETGIGRAGRQRASLATGEGGRQSKREKRVRGKRDVWRWWVLGLEKFGNERSSNVVLI